MVSYQEAELLWARVIAQKTRVPFVLEEIVISTGGAAHFYIKSSYNPENISSIFRKCGGLNISTDRMTHTERVVTVRGIKKDEA